MNLYSFPFVVLLGILIALMSILQLLCKFLKNIKYVQLFILLLVSLLFVYFADWRFLICICGIIFFTYIVALIIDKYHSQKALVGGVIGLVLFLGYFKYADFFINSFRNIIGLDFVTLNIILPLGISFYIFSAIAYLIDIYRGDYLVEKNILSLALYISFFPKLIAGPIVRGKDFFPQVKEYRGIKWDAFKSGIQIYVFGLFKKIVLADRLGVFVDDVFNAPVAFNTFTIILAVLSYSLQIYFDFSGYSDMAIGISKILGFDFKANFNLPYISLNVSEFWKRWHISLSSWFKDYLYIPLGGSRKGKARVYINLMIVMLVSGLWHGASWTYVAWGALHGFASCINKAFGKNFKKLGNTINRILTFVVVTLFWIVFRATSFSNALEVLKGMFTIHPGINQPYTWSFFAILCFVVGTMVAIIHSKKVGLKDSHGEIIINGFYPILDLSKFWSMVIFFIFCGLTIILGYFGNTAFIYGTF